MATSDTQNDDFEILDTPSVKHEVKDSPSTEEWIAAISNLAAGIATIGLLVAIFGVFIIPNDLTFLIGASIVSVAAVGWSVSAVAMIVAIIRRRSNSSDKSRQATSPAKTE